MIKKCGECGGKVDLVARAGRIGLFQGETVPIPHDLELPTCLGCGEEYCDEAYCIRLDVGLKKMFELMGKCGTCRRHDPENNRCTSPDCPDQEAPCYPTDTCKGWEQVEKDHGPV